MRWDNLYVAGLGAYIPQGIETAEQAVAAGRYTEAERVANGIRAVRVADPQSEPPAVMAVAAGRRAGRRPPAPPRGVGPGGDPGPAPPGAAFLSPRSRP